MSIGGRDTRSLALVISRSLSIVIQWRYKFGYADRIVDGEPGVSCLIASITESNPALVTVVDEQRHGLEAGDKVALTSMVGMGELEGREVTVTAVKSPHSYEALSQRAIDLDHRKIMIFGSLRSPQWTSTHPLFPARRTFRADMLPT